jgi:hypothetical protein
MELIRLSQIKVDLPFQFKRIEVNSPVYYNMYTKEPEYVLYFNHVVSHMKCEYLIYMINNGFGLHYKWLIFVIEPNNIIHIRHCKYIVYFKSNHNYKPIRSNNIMYINSNEIGAKNYYYTVVLIPQNNIDLNSLNITPYVRCIALYSINYRRLLISPYYNLLAKYNKKIQEALDVFSNLSSYLPFVIVEYSQPFDPRYDEIEEQ